MIKIFKNAFFIALIIFFSVSGQSAAQEIGGKIHTVREGETLLGISQTDEVMVLAIKILNDLENPLELKVGSKIILPDASFIAEILAQPSEELENRAEEYRGRVSSTLLAELDASYVDPDVLKGMGNIAELPKPPDVNPGFFQGVMPAFKPMYGFIGASLDQGLAALEETWNSPQNASNDYFKTTLGNMPKSSQRVVATTVALSTSGKLPNTSSSRTSSTKTSTKSTTSSSTTRAAGTTTSLAGTVAKKAIADLTPSQAKLAEAVKKAAEAVSNSAQKTLANASKASDGRNYSYSPPPSTTVKKAVASSSSSSSSSSTNWGSIAGGIAGAAAGGLVGGVAGAVAGATIGSKIANTSVGKKIGEVASKLKFW